MKPPYLFLHGGPGMSAIAERTWYGGQLPVDWWDQPRPAEGILHPYAALLDAARERLHCAARSNGGKAALLAHSFGAQIALDLVATDAALIDSLILLAPSHDMRYVWLSLARMVHAATPAPALDEAASLFAQDTGSEANMRALWYQLAAVPTLFDCYWAPWSGEQKARHERILARHPDAFDLAAFAAILADFLRRPASAAVSTAFPVRIVHGAADRIVGSAPGRLYWMARFPHAEVEMLPCGHFIQFELPLGDLIGQP